MRDFPGLRPSQLSNGFTYPITRTRNQDVLCTSKDCPIFYMRKKAQKDVAESVAVLDRCALFFFSFLFGDLGLSWDADTLWFLVDGEW